MIDRRGRRRRKEKAKNRGEPRNLFVARLKLEADVESIHGILSSQNLIFLAFARSHNVPHTVMHLLGHCLPNIPH